MGEEWTGEVKVEQCCGRAAATRVYGRYPLKFILPSKVAESGVDGIWVYAVTYGGGIVSGDSIRCKISIGDGCTTILTTQASTKIYKAVENKFSEQVLEATVGRNAILVVLPDPVTCFASAKYKQLQNFNLVTDANLVLVDWLTSGRRDRGEFWSFDMYKSSNNVYLDGMPLFLDTMKLEQNATLSVSERFQGFHSSAMLLIFGPRLAEIRKQIQENVKSLSREVVRRKPRSLAPQGRLLCSCSSFGSSETGLIVRVLADATEQVYNFLKEQLSGLSRFTGAPPYHGK